MSLLMAGTLATAPLLYSEQQAPEQTTNSVSTLTSALFDAESEASFAQALQKARKGGVSKQAILEARFLQLVDQQDYRGIAALAPEFVARQKVFTIKDSHIFSLVEEWQAVVHYSQALAALETSDHESFKAHIQEAFWLSPRQAGIFAPHIEQLRLEKAMAKIRLNLAQEFMKQGTGEKMSLEDLAQEAPLILLHFWSPWSPECEALLEDFIVTADELTKSKVAVVSVLADITPEIFADANSYREAVNNRVAGFWVIDDEKNSLTQLLRVPDLPTMVLVNRAGKVLFNGHPSDPKLWNEMKKVVPTIQRPSLAPDKLAPDPSSSP